MAPSLADALLQAIANLRADVGRLDVKLDRAAERFITHEDFEARHADLLRTVQSGFAEHARRIGDIEEARKVAIEATDNYRRSTRSAIIASMVLAVASIVTVLITVADRHWFR